MKNIREEQQADYDWLADRIEHKREMFTQLSDQIWGLAETKFEEFESAGLLADQLELSGFRVERHGGVFQPHLSVRMAREVRLLPYWGNSTRCQI